MDLTHDIADNLTEKTSPLRDRRPEIVSLIRFCADMNITNKTLHIDINIGYKPTAIWVHRLLAEIYGFMPQLCAKNDTYTIRLQGVKRAQQCGLLDSQCKPTTGLPPELRTPTTAAAVLRGAFLACGTLHTQRGELTIEFCCPNQPTAHALATAARILGADAHACLIDQHNTLTIKNDAALTLLRRLGAHRTISGKNLTRYATPHIPKTHLLVGANKTRTQSAAQRTCTQIQHAINTLGPENIPTDLLHAAQLRLNHPHASLAQLAHLAQPPTTKHAIAGKLRRLITHTQQTPQKTA